MVLSMVRYSDNLAMCFTRHTVVHLVQYPAVYSALHVSHASFYQWQDSDNLALCFTRHTVIPIAVHAP